MTHQEQQTGALNTTPEERGTLKLQGRPAQSLDIYQQTALNKTVAICRRDPSEPGVAAQPFINKALEDVVDTDIVVACVVPTEVTNRIREALNDSPDGQMLAKYFGLSSQDSSLAAETQGFDPSVIADPQRQPSDVADALRRLMGYGTRKEPEEQ